MPLVTLYFELHQPFRLNPDSEKFFWQEENKKVFDKVADKSYVPAIEMFCDLIAQNPNFKITFSMSGTFLDQALFYRPQVIYLLEKLYDLGREHNQVEYLEETYYHSLAALFADPNKEEFREQVAMHRQKMRELFDARPTAFRNTELMYNNDIANVVADMGYKAMLCEKRDDMFTTQDGRPISPNAVFRAKGRAGHVRNMIVIPRNRNLSDDVAFRFKNVSLTAERYAQFIAQIDGEAVLLGYDFEHIGEHLWSDTGIFDFWRALPRAFSNYNSISMANPTELAENFKDSQCPVIDIHPLATSSWADIERSTHGWLGSPTQYSLFQRIEALEPDAKEAGGELLLKYRYLTTSDHLYYLHEGRGADHSVHEYFSPYGSIANATYVLTSNLCGLTTGMKNFNVRKKAEVTPVLIISPETASLPAAGMGELGRYVTTKSGGLGEVVSALCKGLSDRKMPVHLLTLNLRNRFRDEAQMSEAEWVQKRHKMSNDNIHLVSSSIFENYNNAYEGLPIATAAEFQRQIINSYIKEIRGRYEGRAIIHTHDWIAGGAVVAYAKLRGIPVLHTVHNTHTGMIPVKMLHGVNLEKLWDKLYVGHYNGQECVDSQATAIMSATKLSYVGKTFLKEIVEDYFQDVPVISWNVRQQTKSKYQNHAAVVIPNGISPDLYPENRPEDPDHNKHGLAKRYTPDGNVIEAKKANLLKFQHKIGLKLNPDAILLYWPSRLDPSQKGIQLLEQIAGRFVYEYPDVQIAIIGDPVGGDWTHADIIGRIAVASNGRIAYHKFDEDLSILGYAAASDVFGVSLYEPFGQIDVIGNIYGATATNRDTGGYRDKISTMGVVEWGSPQDVGNGILFKTYDTGGLWWGLDLTVKNHRFFRQNQACWERQAKRIMKEARKKWSLENMVAGYITTYEELNGGKPLT